MKFKSNIEVLKQLSGRGRLLRKQHKLTQQQLSERSGVSLGSLKRFETTGKISLESLVKIIATLGRLEDLDDLLKPQNTPNSIDDLFKK
tara:strand:+ start:664 stop:930 length:267 start_codon:yes stop_codon:yes gene_type:complete